MNVFYFNSNPMNSSSDRKRQISRLLMILPLLLAAAISLQAHGYVIRGQVIDRSNNNPIWHATIIARTDSAKFVAGLESDQSGRFYTAEITTARPIVVEVTHTAYQPTYINLYGTPQGVIDLELIPLTPKATELKEVTVVSESVIQKPDRYIVFPSTHEIEQSPSSISLLNELQMKLPGLRVNEALQSVTVDNRAPVFKINGKQVNFSRITTLNINDIIRIEYQDTPDIRYGDRSAINFVLRPREEGGSFTSNLNSALTTGNISGGIGGTYYYKKSEWNLNYTINWRDYDDRYINTDEAFLSDERSVSREKAGDAGKMGYTFNYLNLGYTYMFNLNTMFAVTAGVAINRDNSTDPYTVTQRENSAEYRHNNLIKTKNDFNSPQIELFFRKQFSNKQSIELNGYGNYRDGKFDRDYSDTYADDPALDYNQLSHTDSKAWRLGAEGLYSKDFRNFTTRVGANYYHDHTENDYTENSALSLDRYNADNLYAYGQIVGRVNKFGYSVAAGVRYFSASEGNSSMNAARFKSNITLNYQFSRKWSVNYLFMYDPSMPGLSQQTDIVRTIDDILVSTGNMNLQPSKWFRNRLYARYSTGKFTGTFWASHSRTLSPKFNSYTYISDPGSPYYGKFMSRPCNGRRDDRINLQLDLGIQDLFKHVSLFAVIGYDGYTLNGFKDISGETDKRIYASINGSVYFSNWTFGANFTIEPQYNLNGDTFSRNERFNSIYARYRYDNWYFTASIANPFTKRGSLYRNWSESNTHPTEHIVYIKDCANMVTIGVNYRINWGKSLRKFKQTYKNSVPDTGL